MNTEGEHRLTWNLAMLELLPPTATRSEFIAKAPQWQRVRARVVRISRVGMPAAAVAAALLGVVVATRCLRLEVL